MRAGPLLPIAVAASLALAGCGGDDDEGGGDSGGERPERQAVRCTPAPAGAKKLAVEPKFRPGDRRRVTIEKTRDDSRRPEPLRATGEADLRVLEGGPVKAVLRWETDQVGLPTPENLDPEVIKRIEDVSERVPIEYGTDAEGNFEDLRNVPEVRRALDRMLDTLADIDPQLEQIADLTRQLVRSEEALSAGMSQDPGLLHGAYGVELADGEELETPYQLPNPLGGEPLAADATFTLESARDASGCAVVELVVEPHEEALRNLANELAQRTGAPPPRDSELEGFNLRNTIRFTYDPGSGWVVKADATKAIEVGGQRRTDRTVMTSAPAG